MEANAQPPDAAEEQIYTVPGWQRLLLWPLALLVRLWGRTLRFEAAPEDLARYTNADKPIALILWHNRLFLATEIVRRYRGGREAYSLVSASKDGAWLVAFFSMVGMRTVRGSSHRLGREAVRELIGKLREGYDIGITPDGPKGPRYEFKPGALVVARRAGVPALLIGARFTAAWRLRSWDGFVMPRPFSRVQMVSAWMTAEELRDRELTPERIRDRLLAINPD